MATVDEQAAVSAEAIEELRLALRGPLFEGSDPSVRPVFNAMHGGTPRLTVRPTGTADVVAAVTFARTHGLPLAIRGGGHSIAGLSAIDGGLLVDLSLMDGVQVDAGRRLARVQGGALLGDVDRETQLHGLAAPLGVVSETGVAGLTLGGGYGWLRRKYGLACDHLVEAEVVCADGQVRVASETSNPDLLWALRGGGGNFGVVTSFTFGLQPFGPVVAFAAVMYPLEEYGEIAKRWRDFMESAPDDVTSIVASLTFPADPHMPPAVHDRPVTIVGAVYSGDAETGMQVLQPLRELGEPLFDMSAPTPYVQVQTGFDGLFPRAETYAYWKSQYVDELTDAAIETIAARAQERPAPITLVNIFAMGGAIAAVDPEATAFHARTAPYLVSIDGVWSDPAQTDTVVAWVRETYALVSEYGNGSVYLNFTGRDGEAANADVDSAFGRNLARLAQVKAAYDPDNLFRFNNNIAPAPG